MVPLSAGVASAQSGGRFGPAKYSSPVRTTDRGPAYRVETDRLVLRCWDPGDAPALRGVLDRSHDHLSASVGHMMRGEPRSLSATAERLRRRRASFDGDGHYHYAVFHEAHLVGEVMLLDRLNRGDREIGYWLDVDAGGRGFATEASAALVRLAFEVDAVDRVEIDCDPENLPSAAVAERLGFTHEATLKRRFLDGDRGWKDSMVWSLFASDYPTSAAAKVPIRAFDVLGGVLIGGGTAQGRSVPPSGTR